MVGGRPEQRGRVCWRSFFRTALPHYREIIAAVHLERCGSGSQGSGWYLARPHPPSIRRSCRSGKTRLILAGVLFAGRCKNCDPGSTIPSESRLMPETYMLGFRPSPHGPAGRFGFGSNLCATAAREVTLPTAAPSGSATTAGTDAAMNGLSVQFCHIVGCSGAATIRHRRGLICAAMGQRT